MQWKCNRVKNVAWSAQSVAWFLTNSQGPAYTFSKKCILVKKLLKSPLDQPYHNSCFLYRSQQDLHVTTTHYMMWRYKYNYIKVGHHVVHFHVNRQACRHKKRSTRKHVQKSTNQNPGTKFETEVQRNHTKTVCTCSDIKRKESLEVNLIAAHMCSAFFFFLLYTPIMLHWRRKASSSTFHQVLFWAFL